MAISEQIRRITDNPSFALFDLVCVFVAFGLWYSQPKLGWWPLIIALTPVIIRLLSGKPFIQRTPFDIVIILFMITAGIGVWAAYNLEAGWAKFWIIVSAVLLYYALAGQPRVNLWLIVGFWALVGVSFAIFFLLTHDWQIKSAKVEFINQIGLWWMSVRPMVLSPDIQPNDDGAVMALMSPFLFALGLHAWRKKQIFLVILVVLGCILLLSGLLLTTSLGAWIALSAGLGIWLIWGLCGFVDRKIQWSQVSIFLIAILILASLSLLFIYLNPNKAINLLDNLPGPASASSRLELFQHTADLIVDFPFTGGGLRNFPGLYSQYILGIPFLYLLNSHNIFLDVTLEQGIIGLLTLLIVFGGTVWILLAHKFQTEPEIKDVELLRWAILASLLVMCLHSLVENVVYGNLGSPLVFFQAGMAISLTQIDSRIGVQNLDTTHKSFTGIRGNRILTWMLLGIAILIITFFAFIFSFHKPLRAMWYANLGSVEMARVELAGWPTGKWDDGSNVALLEPAEGLFHQALSFDQNNTTANHRLGLIAMLRRDYPTAINYLETAHQTNPDHRGIRKSLGYSYLWSGQYDQAIAFLSEFPDSIQEVGTYIWFWENLGRSDFASIARNMVTQFESIDVPMTGDNPAP